MDFRHITTLEAADFTGATVRQLSYWANSGWLLPQVVVGQGGARGWVRSWPSAEVRVAAGLVDLRGPRRGGAHGILPRAARAIRRAPLARYLIVEQDGGEMYAVDTDQALIGAVLEAEGWLSVSRIRTVDELLEGFVAGPSTRSKSTGGDDERR